MYLSPSMLQLIIFFNKISFLNYLTEIVKFIYQLKMYI